MMSDLGIFLSTQENRAIYNDFDANKNGLINYEEFVNYLRVRLFKVNLTFILQGDLNEKRLAVIKHVF